MEKKVLIADDNQMNIELLEDLLDNLKPYGLTILIAEDGTTAYEMVQKEHPNLILLDVKMPGLDGYQICEKIKQDPALGDIYIMMVTAQVHAKDRQKATLLGVDEYITKPFDVRYVRERVKSVLNLTSSG